MPELEARLHLRGIATAILNYLSVLDSCLGKLSHGQEGFLVDLPSWCLAKRRIMLAATRDGRGLLLRVRPESELQEDVLEFHEIRDRNHLKELSAPWVADFDPWQLTRTPFSLFFGMSVQEVHALAPPSKDGDLLGWGQSRGVEEQFSDQRAVEEALQFWNTAKAGPQHGESFPAVVHSAIGRLQACIHQRFFRERKLHRLLRDHAERLLPACTDSFFEHKLLLEDGNERIADFILRREDGLPALLVELEAPVHKVLTSRGELTKEAQHARSQIGEWVAAIDRNPAQNAQGAMSFLSGPKDRLVVIGRGLENRERLLRERFNDTVFWTWDMLLQEARDRWNRILADQYRAIGRTPLRMF